LGCICPLLTSYIITNTPGVCGEEEDEEDEEEEGEELEEVEE